MNWTMQTVDLELKMYLPVESLNEIVIDLDGFDTV